MSPAVNGDEGWHDDRGLTPFRDLALTVMLCVQCFALFVAAPFAALGFPSFRPIADLLVVAYVALAVSVSRTRPAAVLAATVSGAGLIAGFLDLMIDTEWTRLLAHALSVVGFIVLGVIVARAVFAPGPVNTHRLLGAIVLYLNLALFFSTTYRILWDLDHGAFSGLAAGAEGAVGFDAIIYYSFVTLTSTGYGDVLPVNPVARSLANLEAVIGQLFPATILAWMVAQHIEWRRGS